MWDDGRGANADGEGDGISPYHVLARFGLTPRSSAREVLDASYDMTADDLGDPVIAAAWTRLRVTLTRLVADCFWIDSSTPSGSLLPSPSARDRVSVAIPWHRLWRIAATLPTSLPERPEVWHPPRVVDAHLERWLGEGGER